MKRNTWRMVVLVVVAAVGIAMAVDWTDNFESYPTGQWPSPDWIPSGNRDGSVVTDVKHGGQKSFRLYGVLGSYWGTLAHRNIGTDAAYTIDFWIRNGNEPIPPSGHQYRGSIDLHTQANWVPPAARIMDWDKAGKVHGRGGLLLGTYSTLTWYHIKVLYERNATTVHMKYWIDGALKGEENLPASSSEMDFDYVAIVAQAGTVWYDDVSVTVGSGPEPPVAFGDGIYIGQGDVYDTRELRLKSLLNEMKAHNFTELYLNVGNLDADGTLCWGDGSAGNPEKVKHFAEYFRNNYPQARLHAVLNGSTRGKPPVVRLGDPKVRQRISLESALALWYTGLYGVTFDIEPIASRYYVWPEPFEAKMSFFLAMLDSVANRVPVERISTYGESWVDDTRFLFIADVWSIDDYPLVKEHCDHVIDMAYSNLSTDDTPYVEWMTEQTAGIAERLPEGGFSIAAPSFNWTGGGHNPRRHTLENALLGVKAATPGTARIHVWDCPSMDVQDPYCGDNEWLVFDHVWNMNALQGGVEITHVTDGPLTPRKDTVDIDVEWQTTDPALHTDIHWSRVETSQDTYPSGQGSTWSGSGEFSEVLRVPVPPRGKKPYTICLVAHAYCGVANRYSEPKYVSVSYNAGGGQGPKVVVGPAASTCGGAFPDPFSGTTRISYTVGAKAGVQSPVALSIVDRAGRVVRHLVNRSQAAGPYSVRWDGRDDAGRRPPAGVYLYRLTIGDFSTARKIVKSE